MTMKNTKMILFGALIAALVVPFMSANDAYAINYNNLSEFSEEEAKYITALAKEVQVYEILISELKGDDANQETIKYIQILLDELLVILNPLGFYTPTQLEELENVYVLPSQPLTSLSGATIQSCDPNCEPEMAWKSGFNYKIWGVEGTTYAFIYKYSTILLEEKTSIVGTGYFSPDWVEPFAAAFETPTSGGQIQYDFKLVDSSDNTLADYGTNQKTVLSTDYWNPTKWTENKYNNPPSNAQLEMTGRADSW